MEFKKEGKNYVISYNVLEFAIYVGDYPFDKAKRGFQRHHLLTWKLEKKILSDLPSKNLKISYYLQHQCGKCREVINGHKFIYHLNIEHKEWCPARTLLNAIPYRYWPLWYNDRNFFRFMQNSRNFIKADPPWLHTQVHYLEYLKLKKNRPYKRQIMDHFIIYLIYNKKFIMFI